MHGMHSMGMACTAWAQSDRLLHNLPCTCVQGGMAQGLPGMGANASEGTCSFTSNDLSDATFYTILTNGKGVGACLCTWGLLEWGVVRNACVLGEACF